ncbi:MAG: hypothetical protein WC159_13165 [Sphaerochaetaceae bacterium]
MLDNPTKKPGIEEKTELSVKLPEDRLAYFLSLVEGMENKLENHIKA